jgi:hypothetical protein
MPIGFGPEDFRSVCQFMQGVAPSFADYPDLMCQDQEVTVGVDAKALTEITPDEEHLRIGAGLFSRAAFDRMRQVASKAALMGLASDSTPVHLFFERR